MKKSANGKILILKDNRGQALRLIQTRQESLLLVKNINTKRLELVDEDFDYRDTHTLLQSIKLQESKKSFPLKEIGTLSWHEAETTTLDPAPLMDDETPFPLVIKWSSVVHGATLGFLSLLAFFITKPQATRVATDSLVTIQLNQLEDESARKALTEPPPQKIADVPPPAQATRQKQTVRVVPRTDKSKSLKVTMRGAPPKGFHGSTDPNAPRGFQRMGSLGAIADALKGSRSGMGSGLRGPGGGTGGSGRGAGMGRGNGTMGHGHDSGGGYEQALYGKGLIAGQVGGGGGGYGSGWGEGTRGSGSWGYGTKGKGGGHEGYGTSKVGSGSARFSYPLTEEAVVEGGLDREAIDLVVTKNLGQIIYCYELGLQQHSGLRGRVAVDFTINGSGRVSASTVTSTSLHSPQVESCMMSKIRSWKFPKPVGGVEVSVNYPFALQRVSQN